jgi:hypothetical protein
MLRGSPRTKETFFLEAFQIPPYAFLPLADSNLYPSSILICNHTYNTFLNCEFSSELLNLKVAGNPNLVAGQSEVRMVLGPPTL